MFKTLATIAGIAGSTMVALNSGLQSIGYICFFICSASYAYNSLKIKDIPASFLWVFFAMMDAYGCYNYGIEKILLQFVTI